MKFNPKVSIVGITQSLFEEMRLCEAICANYGVEMFINYVDGALGKFTVSVKNMRYNQWHILEDMVKFSSGAFEVEDNFSDVEKNGHILVRKVIGE